MNLIIDGSSLLHRVFWMNQKNNLQTPDVQNSGVIYMFLKSLQFYIKNFKIKNTYVVWDKKLLYPSTNFRYEMTENTYKGFRDKEKAKEVFNNEGTLCDILKTLGVCNLYPRIMEADDVISWLSRKIKPNIIVSTDHDLLQLIDNDNIVYHPFKKKIFNSQNFEKEMGIPINLYLYYKAILGDYSDNIDGVEGYGPIKSKKLALQYANNEIKDENILNKIKKNLTLMDLSIGYIKAGSEEVLAYEKQYNEFIKQVDMKKFKVLCEQLNFRTFVNNINQWKVLVEPEESDLLKILSNL